MGCPASTVSCLSIVAVANKLLDVSYASHAMNFFRSIQLAVSNVTIENVDTIQTPAQFMKPANASQVMENFIRIGSSAHPLELKMSLLLAMAGSIIPNNASSDELLIHVKLDSVQVSADLAAWMASAPFLRFPLRDVLKLDCRYR